MADRDTIHADSGSQGHDPAPSEDVVGLEATGQPSASGEPTELFGSQLLSIVAEASSEAEVSINDRNYQLAREGGSGITFRLDIDKEPGAIDDDSLDALRNWEGEVGPIVEPGRTELCDMITNMLASMLRHDSGRSGRSDLPPKSSTAWRVVGGWAIDPLDPEVSSYWINVDQAKP